MNTTADTTAADTTCVNCQGHATQRITVLADFEGNPETARLISRSYCTACAAQVTEDLAHFEPPHVDLVSVIAITPAWLVWRNAS